MKNEKELLLKKIAQLRNNEIRAGITVIVGIITTMISLYIESTSRKEWHTLAVLGLICVIIGAAVGIYNSHKRAQLIKKLK